MTLDQKYISTPFGILKFKRIDRSIFCEKCATFMCQTGDVGCSCKSCYLGNIIRKQYEKNWQLVDFERFDFFDQQIPKIQQELKIPKIPKIPEIPKIIVTKDNFSGQISEDTKMRTQLSRALSLTKNKN